MFDHTSKDREESWKQDELAAEYFWWTLRFLEMWLNIVMSVRYIFLMESKTKEKIEK